MQNGLDRAGMAPTEGVFELLGAAALEVLNDT
jgi:hypothetical protein